MRYTGWIAAFFGAVLAAATTTTPRPAEATACDTGALRPGTVLRGTYTCSQGLTDLSLVISRVRAGRVDAIFDFHYRAGAVRGRFEMSGTIEPRACTLRLRQRRWLDRPNGWVMVDLEGTFRKRGTLYAGRVIAAQSACTTFAVSAR